LIVSFADFSCVGPALTVTSALNLWSFASSPTTTDR
jgi:hypothetical protein